MTEDNSKWDCFKTISAKSMWLFRGLSLFFNLILCYFYATETAKIAKLRSTNDGSNYYFCAFSWAQYDTVYANELGTFPAIFFNMIFSLIILGVFTKMLASVLYINHYNV